MNDIHYTLRQLWKSPAFSIVAIVALCACLIPARHASLVNPIEALRTE